MRLHFTVLETFCLLLFQLNLFFSDFILHRLPEFAFERLYQSCFIRRVVKMKRFAGRAMCKILLTLNLCLLINALPSMQNVKTSNDLVNDESGSNPSGSDEVTTRYQETYHAGSTGRKNYDAQSKCGYEVRLSI